MVDTALLNLEVEALLSSTPTEMSLADTWFRMTADPDRNGVLDPVVVSRVYRALTSKKFVYEWNLWLGKRLFIDWIKAYKNCERLYYMYKMYLNNKGLIDGRNTAHMIEINPSYVIKTTTNLCSCEDVYELHDLLAGYISSLSNIPKNDWLYLVDDSYNLLDARRFWINETEGIRIFRPSYKHYIVQQMVKIKREFSDDEILSLCRNHVWSE